MRFGSAHPIHPKIFQSAFVRPTFLELLKYSVIYNNF
jgi:hypothetical protein